MSKTPIIAFTVGFAFFVIVAASPAGGRTEADALLARIKRVGREGSGNVEAAQAWRGLVQLGSAALPAVLIAFDGADQIAANWLRTAVDAIAEHALVAGRPLPRAELEHFVSNKSHSGEARRLAYEWLIRIDPNAQGRLLPGMLHDPSLELRRDAVALTMEEARKSLSKGDKSNAKAVFRKALSGARDRDQVDLIAKELHALGVEVNLASHFGLIQQWFLIGPFDSSGGMGFQTAFPPENALDLAASYAGKRHMPVHWLAYTTADHYGVVDLNKALGKHMGAAAYAFAPIVSPNERLVHIRAGSQNAIKIFLNGKQIFFREEYHHGMQMDQHIAAAKLRAGRNELLIKICQNEQTDAWAQVWSFQARVCDETGGPVPFTLSAEKSGAPPVQGKDAP
jgi:hypothetical protein